LRECPIDAIEFRALAGLNRWSCGHAVEAQIAAVPEEPPPLDRLAALAEHLDQLTLPPHLSGAGDRLRRALPAPARWAEVVGLLASELQCLASGHAGAWMVEATSEPGHWLVAVECREPALAVGCLKASLEVCNRLATGQIGDLAAVVESLANLSGEVSLGGATGPVVAAALRRGIPAYRLDEGSLVQLGEGVFQQRIWRAITGQTSHIAVQVANDKARVCSLWAEIGIPLAPGRVVHDEDDACRAALEIGGAVVVKPGDADYGEGVALDLTTEADVRAAYRAARACSKGGPVIVERFLRGHSHRLLVVADRLVAAVRREPARVVGDGVHTLRELVDLANRDPRRGPNWSWPMLWLGLDAEEREFLARSGWTPETVPAPGQRVPLRGDTRTREEYTDVTDRVHPATRAQALDAVRVVGLDVAGLDVIAGDIARPLLDQGGGFLEINAEPSIAIHLAPWCDPPRPVGEAIVDALFPTPGDGRVPLAVVLGTHLADAVAGLTAALLCSDGRRASLSLQDGPAPARLRALMLHPRTEAAALSASVAELLETGLGTDRLRVLVLAEAPDVAVDRPGLLPLVRRLMARADRCVVNLDEPRWVGLLDATGPDFVLASSDPEHPTLRQHLDAGGAAAVPRGRESVILQGHTVIRSFMDTAPTDAAEASSNARTLAAAACFALR
jgi:cyanophycin synthetase